jgi:hypothetical protein
LPVTRQPPSTLTASAVGVTTPDTFASGSAPNTSSCAFAGNSPVSQAHTFVRVTTHDVPPSASATAADTSSMGRIDVS